MDSAAKQSNNLELIDCFKTENWNESTYDQKIENLQKLENYMAEKQGRAVRQVRAAQMRDSARGYYNQQEPQYLNINKNLLKKNDLVECNNYTSVQNVIHEGRHAYQDDAIIGRVKTDEMDKDKIEQWAENSSTLGGVYNSTENCSYVDYRYQPKEVDANNFAKTNIDSFSNRLGDDKAYQKHIENRNFSDEYNKAVAKEIYGHNYEEKIANGINERYKLKNQIKKSNYNENKNIKTDQIKEEKKMSGLGDALKKQTYNASQAQANQKKRESGLSQKRKGNDNAPSPQIKEIGRQPAKSTERER